MIHFKFISLHVLGEWIVLNKGTCYLGKDNLKTMLASSHLSLVRLKGNLELDQPSTKLSYKLPSSSTQVLVMCLITFISSSIVTSHFM